MKSELPFLTLMIIAGAVLYASAQVGVNHPTTQVAEMIDQVKEGNTPAILQMGKRGDKSAVPFLRTLVQQPNKNFDSVAANAQMALAKLGEEEQLNEILREAEGDDLAVQYIAISRKLPYVGGPKVVGVLVRLLDDTDYHSVFGKAGPNGELPNRVVYEPPSFLAMKALAQIVPNPPVNPQVQPTEAHIQIWREWLKKNPQVMH